VIKRLVWNTFSWMKVKQRLLRVSRGIEIEFISKLIFLFCLLYGRRGLGNRSGGGVGVGCVVGSAAAIWTAMAS
jgi:hypothetical protein